MDKNTWFTADLHFGHRGILAYDPRPFDTIEQHDETIISNLQSVIKPWDDFYFLGDFCFKGKKHEIETYLLQIPGNKFFIRGNHDHTDSRKLFAKHTTYLGEQALIKVGSQEIVLNHYPMRSWNKSHHGQSWHLYGHHHGGLDPQVADWGRSMDV